MQDCIAMTGPEVQKARSDLNLSQSAMAEKLGTTVRNIQYWESGQRTPPYYLRLAIAALINGIAPWQA